MSAKLGGIGASSQPQASPPIFSCLQLAVELHPGKSCHSPGASTTVQQQPGQPRVSGDTGGQVLGSVFLLDLPMDSALTLLQGRWPCLLPPPYAPAHPVSPLHVPGWGCCKCMVARDRPPQPFGKAWHTTPCALCPSPCSWVPGLWADAALACLSLQENAIGDEGMVALSAALKVNTTLADLQ